MRVRVSTAVWVGAVCAGLTGTAAVPVRAAAILPAVGRTPGLSELQPRIVTSDAPGSHTVGPGGTPFGVNTDGVGSLIVTRPDGTFLCSGSLLAGGTTLLTAAHCVTNNSGQLVTTNVTANFQTPGGPVTATSTNIVVAPGYNGNTSNGNDLAVIVFSAPVSSAVPRYDIFRGGSGTEFGVQSVKVGYGETGQGPTGAVPGTASTTVKRAGLNKYEADARTVLGNLGNGTNPFGGSLPAEGASVAYDFDSLTDFNAGTDVNNAFRYNPINFGSDRGFGPDEVNSAQGDSGGPTFVLEGGTYKIAGVTSYGFGFGGLPDSSPGTNSSWGEVSVDMRVAHYQGFLNPFVPEPTTLVLVLPAGLLLLGRRRRPARPGC